MAWCEGASAIVVFVVVVSALVLKLGFDMIRENL